MVMEIVAIIIFLTYCVGAYKKYKKIKSDRLFLTKKEFQKKYSKLL